MPSHYSSWISLSGSKSPGNIYEPSRTFRGNLKPTIPPWTSQQNANYAKIIFPKINQQLNSSCTRFNIRKYRYFNRIDCQRTCVKMHCKLVLKNLRVRKTCVKYLKIHIYVWWKLQKNWKINYNILFFIFNK